jgi:hypothetical protein
MEADGLVEFLRLLEMEKVAKVSRERKSGRWWSIKVVASSDAGCHCLGKGTVVFASARGAVGCGANGLMVHASITLCL